MSKVVCGSCEYGGTNVTAKKWCPTCEEGLCEDCEKAHKTNKSSRNHGLISIADYLQIADVPINQTCEHHEKRLDLFCKSHDVAICVACVPSNHKICSDVIPLEEASRNVKQSTAMADLEGTINKTLQNVTHYITNRDLASKDLSKQEATIKETIKQTKSKIIKRLNELEENFLKDLEKTSEKCKSRNDKTIKQLKSTEKSLNKLKRQTGQLKQVATDIQLFLGTRQINKVILEEINSTKATLDTLTNYNVEIELHSIIACFIKDGHHFAKLTVEEKPTNLVFREAKIDQAQIEIYKPQTKYVNDIRIELKQRFELNDSGETFTGCIMLPDNRLLVADYYGRGTLMEYNDKGQHIRDLPVSSKPYDITAIDTDRIAVSYGQSQYIEIMNIKNNKVEKKIETEDNCRGISYQDGKLYIVVTGQGIVVKDKTGNTLNTIKCNVGYYYITVTKDKIYYTEILNNTVHCCSLSGVEIWVFQDESVRLPYGISVDNYNNVFVVGWDSNTLTVIQHDGTSSKTLLTESDGLYYPRAVYYRKDNNTLIIGNKAGNIARYNVT